MDFYKNKVENVKALENNEYNGIETPEELYRALSDLWCAETCTERMRKDWTKENMTLGQCSITSFIAQEIFGGKVYAIYLENGLRHCYNVVGDAVFDLTSAQFKGEPLEYAIENEQFKEEHFKEPDKLERYKKLREMLLSSLNDRNGQ